MATYQTELLNRIVALQKEAMASIGVTADAHPRFYHVQEAFPYFTNRIADTPIDFDGSQDFDLNKPVVVMRLVVAHVTEGYRGEPEAKLYEWIPVVKTYIQRRSQWLQSAAYPARMENLQDARVMNGGGFRGLENTGLFGVTQVCAELLLNCTFPEFIDQVYY